MSFTGAGEVADLIKDALDKFVPDKGQAEKDAFAAQMAQIATNTAAAGQPGMHFRDGAGWTCVAGFAFNFVLRPLVVWSATTVGHPLDLPPLDVSQLTPMLLGLLGLGGMHAYENIKTQ